MSNVAPSAKQQGVALISVLLVFALMTMIAGEIISRNYLDIRRTANSINHKQAYYYALGAEAYARQLLHRDVSETVNHKADGLGDIWAKDFPVFNLDEGKMSIAINDLQGRFNLNNLVDNEGKVNTAAVSQFRDLLTDLDIDTQLADVLADWLDADNNPGNNGAEDSVYKSESPAYLTGNRLLSDRSELMLLKGMTADDYSTLKDYVVALPEPTKYNLNTVSAKLIGAIATTIDQQQLSAIEEQQQAGGYETLNEWLSSSAGSGLTALKSYFDVQSQYYEIIVSSHYLDTVSVVRTQVYRDASDGKVSVLKRQLGRE